MRKLAELEQYNNEELHHYLASFDSESAENIHPNNRKSIASDRILFKNKKTFKFSKKVQQFTENYDTYINRD